MKGEITSNQRLPVIRNRYFLLADLVLIGLAAAVSFWLRLGVRGVGHYSVALRLYVLLAVGMKPLVFYTFGLYQRYWRYSNVIDLFRVAIATLSGSALTALALYSGLSLFFDFPPLPRSIPIIDWLLTMPLVGGTRMTVRILARERLPWQKINGKRGNGSEGELDRVLIMGAGDAGAMLVKEMLDNPELGMTPVGFLDDDRAKTGLRIYNAPVFGTRKDIPRLVEQLKIDEVLIAMPTAPGREIRDVVGVCQETGVRYKTIPGIYELIGGRVSVTQAREVGVEDLLRRDPIRIQDEENLGYLQDSIVLVTGAGGSIGSELCRQIGDHDPRMLLLLGHGENSVYHIQRELRERYPGMMMKSLIADIRDQDRIRHLFENYQPDVIFHAAAHKHVPLMEGNPAEAVTNNICGTQRLLEAAVETGVTRFLLVSTDKAVEPVNVMGVTKRVAELLVQDAARQSGKLYLVVRFGNVLGSRGSVVPLFEKQIQEGGPVTVTHPEMKRFFMTIPEAVQLTLQAAGMGKGGEIFVLDMGKQIRIVELAEQLIRLSGYQPGEEIEIDFAGVRPGEKLSEELFYKQEEARPTRHEKILKAEGKSLLNAEQLEDYVRELEKLANDVNNEGLEDLLQMIVPEYKPVGGVTSDPVTGDRGRDAPEAQTG